MKKITIMMGIFSSFLVLCLYIIGISYTISINKYTTLEGDLKENTIAYIKYKGIEMLTGEKINVKSDTLLDVNFIDSMSVKDDECVGYVEVIKTSKSYNATPYIKCKKYTSPKYQD